MDAALDLINVLHEPSAVFGRIRERPRVLAPFIVIAVLLLAIAWFMRPLYDQALRGMMAEMPPEAAARIDPSRQTMFILIFTPINIFISLLIGAGLLWVLTSLTGSEARYKVLLSVLTYAYVTFVILSIVTALIVFVRGTETVTSFRDLRPPIGLDLLVPGAGGFLGGLLNAINPFSIWGVWLTGVGIAVTHKISRGTGVVVAAVAFLIGASISALLQGLQGM
jgi:hypothetical protein